MYLESEVNMSIQDGKFEVYVVGCAQDLDYIDKKFTEAVLDIHDFNLCESIECADFILLLNEYNSTNNAIFSKEYSDLNNIEIAETLYDLHRLRDKAQFRECEVR